MEKTLSAYRELGPKRYRETSGLYYEDFEVGDVFEHRPGRTITDVDNIWVTLLTLNVQPVHFDAAYAAKTEWKKLVSPPYCRSESQRVGPRKGSLPFQLEG